MATSLATELLIWLVSVPLIATVHEAGHAALARSAGYRVTSFGVGQGPPLVAHQAHSGVTFYLGRYLWTGGACVAIPGGLDPGRRWLYHAGGLLAQAALAAVLWPLATIWPILEVVEGFNLLVAVTNLVPWRLGAFVSDGWQLLAQASPGRARPLYTARARVERLARYEGQVGSRLGTAWCELMLAWMDLLVGKVEGIAERLDQEVAVLDPYLEAVQVYLRAELRRLQGSPLGALGAVRELRAVRGAELPDAAGDLLSLAEARALVALGEPGLARQVLARVAGVGGAAGREAAAVLLEAALVGGDLDEIALAARRLPDALEGAALDPVEVTRALWAAGHRLEEGGRLELAASLRRRATRAASRLLALAPVGDRGPLVRRLGAAAGVRAVDAADP
jgi:hypothetical protein